MDVDYAFGKSMHGVALVKFFRFTSLLIFERTVEIGMEIASFEVDILRELGVVMEETIDIELEFTDSMSDKKINATASLIIKNISTVLKLVAPTSFKSESSFKFQVVAKRYDGASVSITTEF